MPLHKDEFQIRGIDSCKWVLFFNGMQLPGIVFSSRSEADMGVDSRVEKWRKIHKDNLEARSRGICDGSGEMGIYED